MARTRDIVAEIAATIPANRHGTRPWYERASAEHGELLAAIHAGWHDGVFGTQKSPAAKAISAKLRECGIDIGPQGVLQWLRLPKS